MSVNIDEYGKRFLEDYNSGDFEVTLTKYRKQFICEKIGKYNTSNMLEIGCGMEPINLVYDDFQRLTVVEPAKILFESARKYTMNDHRISVINDFIENQVDALSDEIFDLILCVGLIHEVDNPHLLINSVHKLCRKGTTVLFTTNNPNSFHILLGLESGKIKDTCEVSEKAKLFQRKKLYTKTQVDGLLGEAGFKILESGSYFIKPFTHSQMKQMVDYGIISDDILDGLNRMIKYIPELGAENYWIARI